MWSRLKLGVQHYFFLAIDVMNTNCSITDIEEAVFATPPLTDIQLEDVGGSRKGKPRENASLTDEDAFNLQTGDLETFVPTLQDHRFECTLDEALQTDIATLSAWSIIHQGEQDDHLAALALEKGEELPSPTHSQQLLQRTRVPSVVNFIFDYRRY